MLRDRWKGYKLQAKLLSRSKDKRASEGRILQRELHVTSVEQAQKIPVFSSPFSSRNAPSLVSIDGSEPYLVASRPK